MSAKLESKASYESTFLAFLRRQYTRPKPLPAGIKLTNQVAIVTGSNVGLGLEASRQLLELGLSRLIMGVRSQTKGDAAATKLRTAFPSSTITVWIVDMESYDSIRAFAEQCVSLPRIDITILNAGLLNKWFTVVPATNHENTLQVNYLSTALLAMLLLPTIKAKRVAGTARPPVLTLVGSDLAYDAKIETSGSILQQFVNPKAFDRVPWYAKTKLFLIFFVSRLAELVNPDDVIINVSNPGMTKGTAFLSKFPYVVVKFFEVLQFLVGRSAAVGASNYLDAVVVQGKESHGGFTSEWSIKP
jgi:NAD(P)-dependent dehydrogenase (short-subunit alcohol dehydrogenase family)